MKYNVYLDRDVHLKGSDYLFAVQLARQCYIDQGYSPARLEIFDDDGNLCPNSGNITS